MGQSLYKDYIRIAREIGIGSPFKNEKPLKPYNLLFSREWMAIVTRRADGISGFSVNALGFAGYLLATQKSNIDWLMNVGPEQLLEEVVG